MRNAFSSGHLSDKWLVVAVLTTSMFMSLMDHTIVNVAVPILEREFNTSLGSVQWVVTIYMLTQAAVIPTAPFLSRRWGDKRAFVWTLVAFLLGSLLCGFAWNLASLIVFRFVQGIGGGIMLPMVMSLLYQTFEPHERGTASSVMGVPLMVAPIFGPFLGGLLVSTWGWQWAFFINVPIGIIAVLAAQRLLPASSHGESASFDTAGFVAAAGGSASLLYGISTLSGGDTSLPAVVATVAGVVLLVGFVMLERRQQHPLLNLGRFRDRIYSFSVGAQFAHTIALFGMVFLLPVYLQTVRLFSPAEAGTILGAQALATLVVLPVVGRLTDRYGARPVVLVGLALFFASSAAMVLRFTPSTSRPLLIVVMAALGIAGACTQQVSVAAMSGIAKHERAEVNNASTLLSVLRAFAAPLGVAVLSSIAQRQGQIERAMLEATDVSGVALDQWSTLYGIHVSIAIGMALALVAAVLIWFAPEGRARRVSATTTQPAEPSLVHQVGD